MMKQKINKLTKSIALCLMLFLWGCMTDPILPDSAFSDPNQVEACPEGVVSFNYEILPLIVSSCAMTGCHVAGGDNDGVLLNDYAGIRKEVKPGDANDSELYETLLPGSDDKMPPSPRQPLSSAEIELIRNWIDQGAQETSCGIVCDENEASFSSVIIPMMMTYCIGCHNSNLSSGQINLDGYDNTLPYALDGSLLASMKHTIGYSKMPPSGNKMTDCQLAQVEKWINDGAQNN